MERIFIMKKMRHIQLLFVFPILLLLFTGIRTESLADESLSVYGLKGYGYTVSPIIARGGYGQAGGIHSVFSDKLINGDGYITALPVSFTYGDGNLWEVSAATHFESWENTDVDVSESGIGDIFIGGKIDPLAGMEKTALDLALMPYVLIPTGGREDGIGDLYYLNPSPEDDLSLGLNLLAGVRFDRFYLTANIGINYADVDSEWMDTTSLLLGLAVEYQIAETWTSYLEFLHVGNKNDVDCQDCYESDADEDIREVGAGVVWLKDRWAIKLHTGFGLTDTSTSFRGMVLVNRGF